VKHFTTSALCLDHGALSCCNFCRELFSPYLFQPESHVCVRIFTLPLLLLLLQGRLFVSARIVGFYANLFGHKTKFFFLWEDVEEVEVLQPSFTTVGTPSLLFTLKSGRGLEAKNGAKSQDKEGRLKFQFHSFASFSKSSRWAYFNGLSINTCIRTVSLMENFIQDNTWFVEDQIFSY
jgi:hypothetical protein